MSTKRIAIGSIATGYNPRKDLNGRDELRKSIEREGRLLDPITVRPDGDRFIIIDGHRRFSVVTELGWTEIECIVEEVDEKKAAHLSFVKNTERENLNPIDYANHIRVMQDRFGYTVAELVRLGYAEKRNTLDSHLKLLGLPEDIQEMIARGEVKPTYGYHLARLEDPEIQRKLAEEVATKEINSTRKLDKKVKSLIDQRNRGEERPQIQIPVGDIPGVFFKDSRDMSEIPDGSVHLVLSSPPYAIGLEYEEDVTIEDHLHMMGGNIKEIARVTVPGAVVFWNFGDVHNYGTRKGGRPEIFKMGPHYQEMFRKHGFRLTDEIIWEKNPNWVNNPQVSYHDGVRHTTYRVLNNFEHLWIFRKDGDREVPIDLEYESKITKDEWKAWVNGVWKINAVASQKDHPAQFPEELVSRAIRMFSYKGDTVLDPFLGSGTTVKVARDLGRVGIGYEKEEKYKPVIMKKLGIEVLEETATVGQDQPEPETATVASPLDGLVDEVAELTRSLLEQGKDLGQIKTLTVPYIEDKGRYAEPVIDWDDEDPDDDPDDDPDNDGTGGDSPRPYSTNDQFAAANEFSTKRVQSENTQEVTIH